MDLPIQLVFYYYLNSLPTVLRASSVSILIPHPSLLSLSVTKERRFFLTIF